jgi:hypothetical protein
MTLNPRQFGYHGTQADLQPGDVIEPGHERNWSLSSKSHVYYEAPVLPNDLRPSEQNEYRQYGVARLAQENAAGWGPNVYRVKVLGRSSADQAVGGGAARVAPRLKVMGRVHR